MNGLSWLFFCLAPFGLFCSESGNGLILCPVFIILGFVFKWVENRSNGNPTAIVEIEPQKYWECMYKDYVDTWSATFGMGIRMDKEARGGATSMCRIHNCWIPPEEEQERIARENGIFTEKMKQEEDNNWDRIQTGKHYLMNELKEKYEMVMFGKRGRGNRCKYPSLIIEYAIDCLEFADHSTVNEYFTKEKFDISCKEMWNAVLTAEEKSEATKWVEEYEKRLLQEVNDYVDNDISMPTIEKHNYQNKCRYYEINKQYGFIK